MNAQSQAAVLRTPFGMAALVLVCLGWVVAGIFGDGLELHRSALAMPFIVLGALCGLVESLQTGRVLWKPVLISGGLAMLYFACRAFASPVWDLGRHDLHLLALAWLSIATVATCVSGLRREALLVGVLVFVFAGHLAAGLYQQFADPEFSLFRLSRRTGAGVSGLFWHWNNLAALLAITLPIFLGVALGTRRIALRVLFLVLVVLGVWLAYLSKSRAGFAATAIGLAAVGPVFLLSRSRSWSWSARLASWAGLLILGMVGLVAVFMVASRVSDQRGQGKDIGEAMGKSSRLALAGAAFDFWWEAKLFGNGSQSFEALLVENWDDTNLPNWLDNPETVHNEYMQVLTDYGLVGLLLVLIFLCAVFYRVLIGTAESEGPPGTSSGGLYIGAAGGVIGAMVHAVVEFQLHLLPILLLAAIAVGLLSQERAPTGLPVRIGHAVTVVLAVVFALIAVGRESFAGPHWVRWEFRKKATGGALGPGSLAEYKSLVESSPHFKVARAYGMINYELAFASEKPDPKFLEEARWGLEVAHERHEHDPVTLISYALLLDQLGRFEEAAPIHLEAIVRAGARENKYGALGALSMHLMLRGERLYRSRKPEAALGLLLLSRKYMEESHRRNFHFSEDRDYKARKGKLESLINLLQEARIEPQLPRDFPPPPEAP